MNRRNRVFVIPDLSFLHPLSKMIILRMKFEELLGTDRHIDPLIDQNSAARARYMTNLLIY